ncbi:MAG: hypothetical protein LBH70_06090 [Spirochaetaceae bacterium]|nr:hypothetical protein [Spirochaetaceae bacterium]
MGHLSETLDSSIRSFTWGGAVLQQPPGPHWAVCISGVSAGAGFPVPGGPPFHLHRNPGKYDILKL